MRNKLINDKVLTIAATNTVVSEAVYNGEREIIFLKNTSTAGEVISVSIGTEAVNGQGIVLSPGDYQAFSKDAGYTPSNLRINAVDDGAGTGTLAVHEEIGVDV